jgi:hypothetical protein
MPDGFLVESGQLRGAAASVEECCSRVASERKSGAADGVSSGMAGFAVAGACAAAAEASSAAFTGVAKSWRAWSKAAASGASAYDLADAGSETLVRSAGAGLVV